MSRSVLPELPALPESCAPHDWDAIDETVCTTGGIVVRGLIEPELVARFNAEVDTFLAAEPTAGTPNSGSEFYDRFLGHRTLRLHGLCAKFGSAAELVGHRDIVAWVDRMLAPVSSSHLLNAGELIQIGPGEPAQLLHRDTDSWPNLPRGDQLLVLNAIIALSPFTTETGATVIAPSSQAWDPHRRPSNDETVRAVMEPGDVVLFRGDLIHGGGANRTSDEHRRGLSLSYCAGWLRTVENSFLTTPPPIAAGLDPTVQRLLGYEMHDGSTLGAGMLGLYENGDPSVVLNPPDSVTP